MNFLIKISKKTKQKQKQLSDCYGNSSNSSNISYLLVVIKQILINSDEENQDIINFNFNSEDEDNETVNFDISETNYKYKDTNI